MRKIALVTTSDLFFDQRLKRIINSLIEEGFEINSFSRKISEKIPNQFNIQQHQIACFAKSSWLFYAEYNIRILFLLMFRRFDIIYAVDSDTLLSCSILRLIHNNKLIYDAHEYFQELPEIRGKKIIQLSWNFITQLGVNSSDLCITVGDELARILKVKYKKHFYTIRNIPLPQKVDYSTTQREKIIWYQGVLNVGRGLEFIISCMTELPDYKFYMAGEGDITDQLKNITEAKNLSSRVIFLGKLEWNEMLSYSAKARIGVNLLSSESQNYYYSLANRTFDYIYARLPSIHMNFPEYSNLLRKYEVGVLLHSMNKEEFIRAVRKLENEQFYESCIKNCELAIKQNNWPEESNKLITLIHSLQ